MCQGRPTLPGLPRESGLQRCALIRCPGGWWERDASAPERHAWPMLKAGLECGDLCKYNKDPAWRMACRGNPLQDQDPGPAQCAAAWVRLLSSCPATLWPPPRQPPGNMLEAYTMGGKISYEERYFEQRYSGRAALCTAVQSPLNDKSRQRVGKHKPICCLLPEPHYSPQGSISPGLLVTPPCRILKPGRSCVPMASFKCAA